MSKRARGSVDDAGDEDGRGRGKIPEVYGDFSVKEEDTPSVVAVLSNVDMGIDAWLEGLPNEEAQKVKEVMMKNEKRGLADQVVKELSNFNPHIAAMNKQNHIFCLEKFH